MRSGRKAMHNERMKLGNLDVDAQALKALCEKWRIVKLEAFGSVLREDFGPDSDVDILVTYSDEFRPGFNEFWQIEEDLEALLHRKIDLVEPRLLKWVIRDRVLEEARLVYAA